MFLETISRRLLASELNANLNVADEIQRCASESQRLLDVLRTHTAKHEEMTELLKSVVQKRDELAAQLKRLQRAESVAALEARRDRGLQMNLGKVLLMKQRGSSAGKSSLTVAESDAKSLQEEVSRVDIVARKLYLLVVEKARLWQLREVYDAYRRSCDHYGLEVNPSSLISREPHSHGEAKRASTVPHPDIREKRTERPLTKALMAAMATVTKTR
jgi:hypothetical protein